MRYRVGKDLEKLAGMKPVAFLTRRESEAFFYLYGFHGKPLTLKETAYEMGISYNRIWDIENNIKRKLEGASAVIFYNELKDSNL